MTPEEYNWIIDLVKERHHQFKLSFEQAEQVYQFEKEKDLHSDEYLFSFWEEEDYVLDNFQKILTGKQFKKYVTWHKANIMKHEQHLIKSDEEKAKYINYYNELIDFYEQKYIPDFFKEKFLIETVTLSKYKSKVTFLKNEYKAYLENQKVAFISSHYRHKRLFMPNELKSTLLRHKLAYIIPHFSAFKAKMDEPTKATAQFLIDKFNYIPERYKDFFKTKAEEVSSIVKEIKEKYLGEVNGWHMIITETELEKKESQIMQFVLIDKEKYSC
jgi:hypothetical protein